MSDDLLKLLGDGDDNNQAALAALSQLAKSGASLSEVVAAVAPMAIPVLDELLEPQNKADIEKSAAAAHAQLSAAIDPQLLMMANMLPMMFDRQQVEQQIRANIANPDPVELAKKVKQQREIVNGLSEEDHIALTQQLRKILPAGLVKFADTVDSKGTKSVPAQVRAHRAFIQNHSDGELLQVEEYKAKNCPVDAVLDAIESLVSSVNSAGIQNAVNDLATDIQPKDLSDAAINGLEFARDVFNAAAQGNMYDLQDKTNAKAFTKNLKTLTTAFENALVNNGLTPANADALAAEFAQVRKDAKASLNNGGIKPII